VEVGEHICALHIFAAQLDFAVACVLILVEVAERELEDAALQTIRSDLEQM